MPLPCASILGRACSAASKTSWWVVASRQIMEPFVDDLRQNSFAKWLQGRERSRFLYLPVLALVSLSGRRLRWTLSVIRLAENNVFKNLLKAFQCSEAALKEMSVGHHLSPLVLKDSNGLKLIYCKILLRPEPNSPGRYLFQCDKS